MFDLYIHRKAEYKHLHHIIIHRIYIFEIAKFKAIIFKTFNNKYYFFNNILYPVLKNQINIFKMFKKSHGIYYTVLQSVNQFLCL